MEIRRSGNFGIIDTGSDKGLISFSIGGRGKGWAPRSSRSPAAAGLSFRVRSA